MIRKKAVVPPWAFAYQAKPMPHVYSCSVCDERSKVGRRRLTKDGIAFVCSKCLRKALFKARERAANRERLLKAEYTIRERENERLRLRNAEQAIKEAKE